MIFISYSSKDNNIAQEICKSLEDSGIKCWIAPRNVLPGSTYPSQIMKAIRACSDFILIASDNINASHHVQNEVAQAFDMRKKIIPIRVEEFNLSDELKYYLSRVQWITADKDFANAIDSIKGVMIFDNQIGTQNSENGRTEKKKNSISSDGVRLARYSDLLSLGISAKNIADQLVANDRRLYPNIPIENEGTPDQWGQYIESYPDTFCFLVNERNVVVGNWSFLAVHEDTHEVKLSSGELQEATFTLDETEFLLFPGDYIGYLLNLSVNDEYRNPKNTKLLYEAFIDQLVDFGKEGIFFKKWYVNVFRKDHEMMYRRLGFDYFVDNKTYGKLYKLDCTPFPEKSMFRNHKELRSLYEEHFM